MKFKYIFLIIFLSGVSYGQEFNARNLGNLILAQIKKEKITKIGIITDPFEKDGSDMVFKENQLKIMNLKTGEDDIIRKSHLEVSKPVYAGGSDFFLVAYNIDAPVYALYHDNKYPNGAFTLYFCHLEKDGLIIEGRVIITDSVLGKQGWRTEELLLIHLHGWEKSRFHKEMTRNR